MALTFPYPATNGQTYTDDNAAVWQYDGVKWNVVTGTTKKLFNGLLLGLSMNYNLTNTATPINWDVETTDTSNYWNALDPSKINIPATGYYNLNLTIFTDAIGAGYYITVVKNGVTTIVDGSMNPNQAGVFNETIYFNQGDYIQIDASETSDSGAITDECTLELVLMGLALGTGVSSSNAFSGVKTILALPFSTTSTLTAIPWTSTAYDTNANALALTYWNGLAPTRITILTTGYYQINVYVETGAVGGTYTLTLRKNGVTSMATTTMAPNDAANINQLFQLNMNDYIELLASENTSAGNITDEAHIEVIRMGV